MSDEVKTSVVPSFCSHPMGQEEGETFVLGYMDKVDWECEVGLNSHNTVYSHPEGIRSRKGCAEGCGIVEIKMEFVRVIQEGYCMVDEPGLKEELLNFSEVEEEDRKPFAEVQVGKRFGFEGNVYIKCFVDYGPKEGQTLGMMIGTGALHPFGPKAQVVPLEK